jgi:hypothetical protein
MAGSISASRTDARVPVRFAVCGTREGAGAIRVSVAFPNGRDALPFKLVHEHCGIEIERRTLVLDGAANGGDAQLELENRRSRHHAAHCSGKDHRAGMSSRFGHAFGNAAVDVRDSASVRRCRDACRPERNRLRRRQSTAGRSGALPPPRVCQAIAARTTMPPAMAYSDGRSPINSSTQIGFMTGSSIPVSDA